MQERLNANGAILAASTASSLPLGGGAGRQFEITGKPVQPGEKPQTVTLLTVGPRYFDALGVGLMRGRPRAGQVSWLILRRGLIHLAVGLTLGLAGAFGVGRLLRSLLFQTGAADPVTLVSITMLLIVVAILACLWPAWQATRLNPVAALRSRMTIAAC